ncbi:MAG: hypothetical protein MUE41_08170, partial [Gemmatimonadaceae bacterium]|nr:hypothetical protein [Gemmatimonadaceae bacterium]
RLDPLGSQWLGHWRSYMMNVLRASLGIVVTLNAADGFYNWAVANGRDSDSFIAAASQQYPNVPGSPFPPVNLESDRRAINGPMPGHNGETRSAQTATIIFGALRDQLGVPGTPIEPQLP